MIRPILAVFLVLVGFFGLFLVIPNMGPLELGIWFLLLVLALYLVVRSTRPRSHSRDR